jgi:hypothetical protein
MKMTSQIRLNRVQRLVINGNVIGFLPNTLKKHMIHTSKCIINIDLYVTAAISVCQQINIMAEALVFIYVYIQILNAYKIVPNTSFTLLMDVHMQYLTILESMALLFSSF